MSQGFYTVLDDTKKFIKKLANQRFSDLSEMKAVAYEVIYEFDSKKQETDVESRQ